MVNGQDNNNEKCVVLENDFDEFSEKLETIKEILQNYYDDDNLQITSMECLPGSKQGDNYMSVIKRINVKFKFGSDLEHSKSLIVKRHIVDKVRRELFRCTAAFKNEIAAYCHLIPVLNKFSNNNLPYPNCLFAGNIISGCDEDGDIIAMEDLKQDDYKMMNRLEGVDFEHSAIIMKELGNFHAVSLAMKIMEPVKFCASIRHIHEVVFTKEAYEFYSHVLESSMNEAISSLSQESNKDGEFDEAIKVLKRLNGKRMFDIMMNHVTNSDDKWNVIVHGDLWINNIMFNYVNGKVNHAKFVDLQTIRYSNMVCDLLHFLFSSTKFEMRIRHTDELIQIYRESLINNLREHLKSNYSCELETLEKIYTFENIKHELAKRSLFGLGMAFWVLPAITFVVPNVKDIDSLMKTIMDSDKHDEIMASLKSKEFHIRIRDIVREFNLRGFLSNIFIDV